MPNSLPFCTSSSSSWKVALPAVFLSVGLKSEAVFRVGGRELKSSFYESGALDASLALGPFPGFIVNC